MFAAEPIRAHFTWKCSDCTVKLTMRVWDPSDGGGEECSVMEGTKRECFSGKREFFPGWRKGHGHRAPLGLPVSPERHTAVDGWGRGAQALVFQEHIPLPNPLCILTSFLLLDGHHFTAGCTETSDVTVWHRMTENCPSPLCSCSSEKIQTLATACSVPASENKRLEYSLLR